MRKTQTRTLNRRRPVPHDNPETARLLAICAALASELAIVRERLDTHERLAGQGKAATLEEVEDFSPSAADGAHRDGLRNRLIGVVFRPLVDDAEREAREAAARAERQASTSGPT